MKRAGTAATEPCSGLRCADGAFAATILALLATALPAFAQVPPVRAADQSVLLRSDDPRLARNKRLVYDMWREVVEAGHVDRGALYFDQGYLQHNPKVPTGRAAALDYFARTRQRKPVSPTIGLPLISIVAEGDLVVLSFAREYDDPSAPGGKYVTTWFDMFRIREGKIVEHWDPQMK